MDQGRATAAFQRHDQARDGTIPFAALLDVVQKLTGVKEVDGQTKALLREQFQVDHEGRVRYADFLTWVYQVEDEQKVGATAWRPQSGHLADSWLRSFQEDAPSLACQVEDGVAVISLGSQGEDEQLPWGTKAAEHCLSPALLTGLFRALDHAQRDAAIQVIVVTAQGEHWSNGIDRLWVDSHPTLEDALLQAAELLFAQLLKFPKPTVAALNGHAVGAGAALALAFDVRVMNSERGLLGVPGVEVGIAHSAGVTALLAAKLPLALRHEFIVFGQSHTAETLLQHGVVCAAVPADRVRSVAVERATALGLAAPHPANAAQIKAALYHTAIAALERELEPSPAQSCATRVGTLQSEAIRGLSEHSPTAAATEGRQGKAADKDAHSQLTKVATGGRELPADKVSGVLPTELGEEQRPHDLRSLPLATSESIQETGTHTPAARAPEDAQETAARSTPECAREVETRAASMKVAESTREAAAFAFATQMPDSTLDAGRDSPARAAPESMPDTGAHAPLPQVLEGVANHEVLTLESACKTESAGLLERTTDSTQETRAATKTSETTLETTPSLPVAKPLENTSAVKPPESMREAQEPTKATESMQHTGLNDSAASATADAQKSGVKPPESMWEAQEPTQAAESTQLKGSNDCAAKTAVNTQESVVQAPESTLEAQEPTKATESAQLNDPSANTTVNAQKSVVQASESTREAQEPTKATESAQLNNSSITTTVNAQKSVVKAPESTQEAQEPTKATESAQHAGLNDSSANTTVNAEKSVVQAPESTREAQEPTKASESAQHAGLNDSSADTTVNAEKSAVKAPESTREAQEPTNATESAEHTGSTDSAANATVSAKRTGVDDLTAATTEITQEPPTVPPQTSKMPQSKWEAPVHEQTKTSECTQEEEAKKTDTAPETGVPNTEREARDDGLGLQADESFTALASTERAEKHRCEGMRGPAAERLAKGSQDSSSDNVLAGERTKPEEPERENPRASSRFKEASYRQVDTIWEGLQDGSTVLIKGSWLVAQADAGAVLPRRQDLPLGAAWTVDELRREYEGAADGCNKPPNLISVSYRWLAKEHPDAEGVQLRRLAPVLKLSHADPARGNDTAVFIDWCSLFQEKRSGPETTAFEQALGHVSLWYGHSLMDVLLLTIVPAHLVQYNDAGWPTFECALCQLATPCSGSACLLDLGRLYTNSDTVTVANWMQLCRSCAVGRSPPLVPEAFENLIKTKTFTEGSDCDLVIRKYEETFADLIHCAQSLQWQHLGWQESQCNAIASVLSRCSELRVLDLSNNPLGNMGITTVVGVLSSCTELRVLALRRVGMDAEAARSLATALQNSKVQELYLTGNSLGDAGAAAVAPASVALSRLDLAENGLGEVGASALAEAIPQCNVLCDLDLRSNELRPSTQAELRKAWLAAGKLHEQLHLDSGKVVCEVSMDEIVGHVKSLGVQTCRQQSSEALRMLVSCGDTELQTAIADAGAVPALVELLKDDDVGVREQAAGALRNLAYGNADLKNTIARAGAMPLLVKLLEEEAAAVRECAVGVLRNLATGDATRKTAIAHAGALPALVGCLADSVPAVREQAAGVLRNLCVSDEDLRSAIERIGAMPVLVGLLTDKSVGVREHVAAALRGLALDAGRRTAIVRVGAVRAVVGLLGDDAPCVREQALAMLCNLAQGDTEAANSIVQAGALPRLVAFLLDESAEMRKLTAWALGHLAAGSVDIRTAEYEPTLMRLTANDALSRRNATVQTNIEQVGAMPLLVRLLADTTIEVRKEAAATLAVLAVGHKQNQASAVRAGAIPPLIILLADVCATIREMAAGALWALAANLGQQKPEAASVLKTLLEDPAQEVRDMATRALSRLQH